MHLKVPPVAVFAVASILIIASDLWFPQYSLTFPGQKILAIVIVLAGLVPGGQAVVEFARKKTTTSPMAPHTASTLVTNGIYRFSRNPMYLSLLCLLLALTASWGTASSVLIVPAFVWYMTEFQIKPEEASLRQVFGPEYEAYLLEVRRWI